MSDLAMHGLIGGGGGASGGAAQELADAYVGEWSDAAGSYNKGDIVAIDGKAYVANATHTVTPNGSIGYTGGAVGSGSSISLTVPQGAQVGDLMIVTLGQYNGSTTGMSITGGSGTSWTALMEGQSASGSMTTYGAVRYRTVAAGDLGATLNVGVSNSYAGATLTIYRGHTGAPTAAVLANNSVGSGGIARTPAMTPASSGAVIHSWMTMNGSQTGHDATIESGLLNAEVWKGVYYFIAARAESSHTSGSVPQRELTITGSNSGVIAYSIHVPGVTPGVAGASAVDMSKWDELPPLGARPEGAWELIGQVSPTGSTATPITFSAIPAKYTKLRVKMVNGNSASSTNMHYQLRFNGSTASYGCWIGYHSSAAENITTSSSGSFGYIAYSYFYIGSGRQNYFECEIENSGFGYVAWESRHMCFLSASQYPYGSRVKGVWGAGTKVSSIELYASASYTWGAGVQVYLYGMVE